MNPYKHAIISAKKFGGIPEDYFEIHKLIDCTKQFLPDVRHRMILHNNFGIYIAQRVFGELMTNSDNRVIMVKDIAEQHILDDLHRIPTLEQCLQGMPLLNWMGGNPQKKEIKIV
jgi:RNA-binding protein YlmH